MAIYHFRRLLDLIKLVDFHLGIDQDCIALEVVEPSPDLLVVVKP